MFMKHSPSDIYWNNVSSAKRYHWSEFLESNTFVPDVLHIKKKERIMSSRFADKVLPFRDKSSFHRHVYIMDVRMYTDKYTFNERERLTRQFNLW